MVKNNRGPMFKWGAAAVCLLMIACVIAIPHLRKASDPGGTAAHADKSIVTESSTLELLTRLGLDAEVVENPATVSSGEPPYVSRDDAVHILKNAELIADCTVEEISRIKIHEPNSDSVWFITSMILSRNAVIRGNATEDRFRVVSAAVTNEPVDFFAVPGLENCREGMRAAFILRSIGEADIWTVGGAEIAAKDLGDYFAVSCMGYDGEIIEYEGNRFSLDELD